MTAPARTRDTAGIAVEFDRVSIVFGERPETALELMDRGLDRAAVKAACGQVLGVHDCSLTVAEGEISGDFSPDMIRGAFVQKSGAVGGF